MTSWPERSGIASALASAVLFGTATPAAKAFLGVISPLVLAGLFYLGSGFVLSLWAVARRVVTKQHEGPRLQGADLGWLGLAAFCGGVAGPVLLFSGLAATPASTSSLLLNLEGVLTALLACLVFGEHLDRRLLAGMAAILAGCVVLGWRGGPVAGAAGIGALAVAGACLAWAIDNNVTRKISGGDAVLVGAVKGAAAGSVTLGLGLASGAAFPGPGVVAAAVLVGVLGYGLSLVLFVRALRDLGAARAAAYFSVAPFTGALLSVSVLGEPVTGALLAGGCLVGLGVWLHLTEDHGHEHEHPEAVHVHWHRHDPHHGHGHGGEDHAHPHHHPLTVHSHPHYPDLHHRHGH
ncbi:MAG: DMT family transporter [Deltaproteobacteria bacterium]|nr:DMT family transporter [Deltaproteobacteria bacterium]